MSAINSLNSLIFISLPEGFTLPKESFHIDTTIPLPVQLPEGVTAKTFDMANLSWEMILAGILVVLAYDTENEHILYYRSLINSAKPNLKQELCEAAILKARNEDYEIADEIFASLRGLDPEDTAITLNTALFYDQRAESYRRSGLEDDADAYDASAYEFYKKAMAAEPPVPDAFFNAGFFYLKQKNYSKAKDSFETYLTLIGGLTEKEITENISYKKERASEIVQNISNRNLDDDLFKSAFDFISMGQEEKGLESIRKFLEHNPKVWNAWFMLGWGLRKSGRWQDAKAAFEQTLQCGGDKPDTYNELSICLLELGEFDEAKKMLAKALSLEPDNTKIISNLGYLSMKQGNIEEARKYYMTVLEIDPKDKIALSTLATLEKM